MNTPAQLQKFMFLLLLIILSSCGEEMVFDADLPEYALNQKTALSQDQNSDLIPCDEALYNLKGGASLIIDCAIDLGGKQVTLNENVTLNYGGGTIQNGTLIFKGGAIDGRFLNKDLQITGTAQLVDPVFNFVPARWGIIQGQTDRRSAFSNRITFEKIINKVKSMGAETFKIGAFDAYFDVVTNTNTQDKNFYPWLEGINIPSDFTLLMSSETHLRVFPNDYKKYTLVSVYKSSNVHIIGGNLYGDRDEHDYSDGGTHEWGHVLMLKSATNTILDGVTIKNGTGDGLKIESTGYTFQSYYKPSHDITVTHCVFDSNRRNNLALTDGHSITIENNQFFRAGIDTPKSKGTNPRYAIDVEPYIRPDSSGKLIDYERVKDVIIRNNVQKASGRGGFIIIAGENVTIDNNKVENGIAFKVVNNMKISNNEIISNGVNNSFGISAGHISNEGALNNEVNGNYVKGFNIGITIEGYNQNVYKNEVVNCDIGIGGRNFAETKVVGNTINSTDPHSRGIFVYYGSVNRVLFKDNVIDTPNNPFKFEIVNLDKGQEKYCAHLVNNKITSSTVGLLLNTNGISLMENTINTGLKVFDSRNFSIEHNTISSKVYDGIYFRKKNTAVKIMENSINVSSSRDCIRIQNTTDRKDIQEIGNKCL